MIFIGNAPALSVQWHYHTQKERRLQPEKSENPPKKLYFFQKIS